MSYIRFVEGQPKPKTKTWYIVPVADPKGFLGWVKWFAPWRCYSFYPNGNAFFERRCLRDIADFCEARTAEHKAREGEPKKVIR